MKTILVTAGVSLILALFGTPLAIRVFTRRGYGQLIREEGPAAHATKRGTPTMGGTVIVVASLIGYLVGHETTSDPMSASGLLVLMLMTGLGFVGFIDDFIKIYKQTSLGLRSGAKLAGQAVVGALFALLVLRYADGYDLTPADAHLSFLRDFGPSIGVAPFVLWIMFMIAGTSNAVNLTDGLDGLATGAATLVLAAYVLIANWQLRKLQDGRQVPCLNSPPGLPGTRSSSPAGGLRQPRSTSPPACAHWPASAPRSAVCRLRSSRPTCGTSPSAGDSTWPSPCSTRPRTCSAYSAASSWSSRFR